MGPASAPGWVIESVAAPWRTVTLGQSISTGVPAGLLPPAGGVEDFPNPSHPPSLSVIDSSAAAGRASRSAHARSAARPVSEAATEPISVFIPKLGRPPSALFSRALGGHKAVTPCRR